MVLPDSREGLSGLEAKLAQMDLLNGLDGNLGRDKIQVSIPKFKLEESLDLVAHLRDVSYAHILVWESFTNETSEWLVIDIVWNMEN